MKRIYAFYVLVLLSLGVMAVPARKTPIQVQQPDGSSLTILLQGDESRSRRITTDGYEVVKNESGYYVYAGYSLDGKRYATPRVAKDPSIRSLEDSQFAIKMKEQNRQIQSSVPQLSVRDRKLKPRMNSSMTRTLSTDNKKKGLVFLVEFSDKQFVNTASVNTFYTNMLNQKDNYTNSYGQQKSARDFFFENSMGQFDPSFKVIGPIKVSKSWSYYGQNVSSSGDDNVGLLIQEVLTIANNQNLLSGVDLSEYCTQDANTVDFFYFFYAGYGEASGGSESTIWPHAWEASGWKVTLPTIQGKSFNNYACSNELMGGSGANVEGIGTFCHEFSHVLGLMDMYDTNYDSDFSTIGYGLDSWSLMNSGSYNGDGYIPCNHNAYERYSLGWISSLTELTDASQCSLNEVGTSNQGFIIKSNKSSEYFVLENRQQTGWDRGLPGHGMLIYHVDYVPSVWANNEINIDPSHQYFQLEAADNSFDSNTLSNVAADAYPGSSKRTSFTDLGSPNMKMWNGTALNKPITNIKETNGVITFDFKGGFASPVASASSLSDSGFTANWTGVSGATEYYLDIYTKTVTGSGASVSVKEPFSTSGTTLTGWSSNGTSYYNTSGNFGDAAPSIKMDGSGDYFQTQTFTGDITEISFGEKGQGASGSSLTIYQVDGATETLIYTRLSFSTSGSVVTVPSSSIPAGTKKLKFLYTKSSGNLAIDDVTIKTSEASVVKNYLSGYQNRNMGNMTSTQISGLTLGQTYYFVVRASNGTMNSINSNEVEVKTNTSVDQEQRPPQFVILHNDQGEVFIQMNEVELPVAIYTMDGTLVRQMDVQKGVVSLQLPQNGVYLVRIGDSIVKVIGR